MKGSGELLEGCDRAIEKLYERPCELVPQLFGGYFLRSCKKIVVVEMESCLQASGDQMVARLAMWMSDLPPRK